MPENVETTDRGVDAAATAQNIVDSVADKGNIPDAQAAAEAAEGASMKDLGGDQPVDVPATQTTPTDTGGESQEPSGVQQTSEDQESTQGVEGQEDQTQQTEQVSETEQTDVAQEVDAETYEELLEMGVDLGVHPEDVPAELAPTYNQMAQAAMDQALDAKRSRLEAQEAQLQLQDFAETLEENPQQILVTMAAQDPDSFSQAVSTFERMQTDEEFRDMKLRELEAEAKLKAAERKEQARTQTTVQEQADRIRQHTHRAARQRGVDPETAEQFVAQAIRAQGGEVGLDDVNEIVSNLAPQRNTTPEAKTPETQQKETQSNKSVQGKGQAQGTETQPTAEPDGESADSLSTRDEIFGAVQRAADRANTVGA